MNVQSLIQKFRQLPLLEKFRSLPPHFRYPILAAVAVVVLVGLHAVFDRPAPAPTSGVAIAAVPTACNQPHADNAQLTVECEDARAKRAYEAQEAPDLCRYKGQIVGCACPPGSWCAAQAKGNAKWRALIARESVGAAPPLPAASAKPAPDPATTAVASASTAAAPVPVVPAATPAGVKPGLLHEVAEGKDSFGAWLTIADHVTKASTLTFAVPALSQGATGARRMLVSSWIHVAQPVQTITLREEGPAAVTLNVDKQTVSTGFDNSGVPRSQQVVANLQPGWYLVKLTGAEAPSWASRSSVEVELGSTNLNPTIPVPYWVPEKAPAKAPAASAKATPAPVPAAIAAAPKAAQAVTKAKAAPMPVKAGTPRGQKSDGQKP